MLAHWNISSRIDMSLRTDTLFWYRANQSLFFLLNAAFFAEKQQIPVLQFFGLTRLGLKLTMKAYQCVLYVWSLEIHLSRWEGWDSINRFNPDEYKCLSLDLLRHISWSFCVRQVQLRWGDCSFWWYWWSWWPSRFKVVFRIFEDTSCSLSRNERSHR